MIALRWTAQPYFISDKWTGWDMWCLLRYHVVCITQKTEHSRDACTNTVVAGCFEGCRYENRGAARNDKVGIVTTLVLMYYALQWRHNERDGFSNHQPHDCLLNRLFKAQIKENIKIPRHWPLWGEFTVHRWIPRTNGQWRGKCFHLMTSSCWVTYLSVHCRHPYQS